MAERRILVSMMVVLACAGTTLGQTYNLAETSKAGDCFRVHLDMKLEGELKVSKDGKPVMLKLSALASHEFPQRILVAGGKGIPPKAARIYETAKATITVGNNVSERVLRPDRKLIVVQKPKDQTMVYCPKGALTRDEMELVSDHFDGLAVTGLLPDQKVELKQSWKVSTDVAQSLCHLDGLTAQELLCKLEDVTDNVARVTVVGTVTGIDMGAMVKITVDAAYQFDLKENRLVSVLWKQKDERGQGPASPASTVATTYALRRTAIAEPAALSDAALVSIPDDFDPPVMLTQLSYRDSAARFEMLYGREWQIVGQTKEQLIMRLMDRGDFVAQVTITPWTKARTGEHMTAEAFQKAMAETPGWEQAEVLQAGEVPDTESGRWVYRVSALGNLDGMPLLQNFYLVAGTGGDQVVLAFTMTKQQAEKLGNRDLSLVGSIELPPLDKDR